MIAYLQNLWNRIFQRNIIIINYIIVINKDYLEDLEKSSPSA
jgi:hypothetical protein